MSKIAENIPDSGSCRDLSHFLSSSPWSPEEVMKFTRSHIIRKLGDNGAIIFDETGQQKYGYDSVGVSHQYLGTLGHTCTAQVGVFASYCIDNLSSLIDFRLFLPDSWVYNHQKSLKAGVPLERIEHKTKPELALEMLDSFISEGIQFSYIQADGLYGNDSKFISGLYQRNVAFICDIPSDTLVYITEPELIIPERQGNRGRLPSKPKVLNTFPVQVSWLAEIEQTWESVSIRFTDRGIKSVDCAVKTVWRRQGGIPSSIPIKLVIIRDPDENRIRFAFTNMIRDGAAELAKCQANRYWIERNFEDAKSLCDLDSFRGRNWIAWHHHITLSAIALFVLLVIQQDFFKKSIFLSLNQVVSIIKHKNPLRKLTAEELADAINYVNDIRTKMWLGRLKKFMKQRFQRTLTWIQELTENRLELPI